MQIVVEVLYLGVRGMSHRSALAGFLSQRISATRKPPVSFWPRRWPLRPNWFYQKTSILNITRTSFPLFFLRSSFTLCEKNSWEARASNVFFSNLRKYFEIRVSRKKWKTSPFNIKNGRLLVKSVWCKPHTRRSKWYGKFFSLQRRLGEKAPEPLRCDIPWTAHLETLNHSLHITIKLSIINSTRT